MWPRTQVQWPGNPEANQSMSLPNWPLSHIDYFESKTCKKKIVARRTLWASFFSLKAGDKTPLWKVPSQIKRKDILITRDRGLGAWKSVKQTSLNSALCSWPPLHHWLHLAQTPLLSMLHKLIISLSKMNKSFLLWSLLRVFILFWRFSLTGKKLIKRVCFPPVNMS